MGDEHLSESFSRRVALLLRRLTCAECGVFSDAEARGWLGYRIDVPALGEPPALEFYCPGCAERVLGR